MIKCQLIGPGLTCNKDVEEKGMSRDSAVL